MPKLNFLARLLPESVSSSLALSNLIVIVLCVLTAVLLLVPLVLAAMLLAFLVSEKLKAGMAGISILLIFVSGAAVLDVLLLVLLLVSNLRFK